MKKREKGQVWVETVTYTLIALVMIGLVLSFAKPKIEELQDRSIIDQSVQMLKDIDLAINYVYSGEVGNTKKIDITIKKGSIKINSANDSLTFEMKSRYLYSQPKQIYEEGPLDIYTYEDGKYYPLNATLNYSGIYNITYSSMENQKMISRSSTSYEMYISKKGGASNQIDIQVN